MIWMGIAILVFTSMVITTWWPTPELQEYPCSTLPTDHTPYKLLDIRDALDYEACHVPGSVNISLGRLPYVARKDLEPEHSVIIIGKKDRKSKKAARILKKKGFRKIYVCMNGI
ncbi:rhodanese-like domain-containing protein [Paenibacillus sp. CMAA1364]